MIYLFYSQSQRAYHRDRMDRHIEDNLTQLTRGVLADWIVVGMALDHKEADKLFPVIKHALGRPIEEVLNEKS